jgi:hypothetical protein
MTANICNESRRIGFGGNTGTAMILAFKHAMNAMVKFNDGAYTNTTLDDGEDNDDDDDDDDGRNEYRKRKSENFET